MVPNKLYELLPYVYVFSGAVIIALLPGVAVLTTLSGILLLMTGGLVWVLRSEHRRRDLDTATVSAGMLPFWLYELLPFLYISTALLLFAWTSDPYFYPSMVIFLVVGHQLWLLRGLQRHHQKPPRFA
ncbi:MULTISPECIES: hypothetical protein [Alkalimonas]|uniref:Uncharacterized protein n=1 Tax=Alkalimonas mucilaginosa TaxID=3057676 RepID=A0ABU7JG54_9GAMM|nr:hypothetical protein [Alkalimonas sp. MEB004]MEE2024673.1 hypothetical protein [Alkalimonas sp. MEB004]